MTLFAPLIERLARAGVEFVVIGGVALVGRGGSRLDGLEQTKRASGRAKDLLDLEVIAALKKAPR